MNVKEMIAKARALVAEGKLAEAQALTDQVKALKAIDEIDTPEAAPAAAKAVARVPFGEAKPGDIAEEADQTNMKAWADKRAYVKKYGEIDPAFAQITKEIYGEDYFSLASAKHADLNKYLKTGRYNERLSRVVLLTQDQIASAFADGVSVQEIKATQIEAQDTLGGYLVPEDFHNEISTRLQGLVFMRRRASVVQTSRDIYSMLRRTGGNSRYRGAVRITKVDEIPASNAASQTNDLFGKIQIPINTFMANTPVSRSLLEDTGTNLQTDLAEEFASAYAVYEDEQFLVGNGIGGPAGILKDATLGGPNGVGADVPTIVNNGNSTALVNDVIRTLPYKLDSQYRQGGQPIWAMNKTVRSAVASLKDSQNRYLLGNNNNLLAEGQQETLGGYAIEESEAMPGLTASYFPIIFGDFKGYRIVDRIGMSIERYMDSNTVQNDSVIFYLRKRLGAQIVQPERFVVLKYV